MPEIVSLEWGKIVVRCNNIDSTFKDCRIYPTGSDSWNWNKTGTQHIPGIQYSDFSDLLNSEISGIVLSTGMDKQLQIHPDTLGTLKKLYPNIKVVTADTKTAVEIYRSLQTKHTIGIFHSTC